MDRDGRVPKDGATGAHGRRDRMLHGQETRIVLVGHDLTN